MHVTFASTDLGKVLIAARDVQKGVTAVLVGPQEETLISDLQKRFPDMTIEPGFPGFEKLVAKVLLKLENPGLNCDLPLDMQGTPFQIRVWKALKKIPSGQTATYADIANRIKQPQAVRAVANACGANHLAILVPCHRVIRSDGTLGGYRWGKRCKKRLLQKEQNQISAAAA